MTKRRVSAKQRLEVVEAAYKELKSEHVTDVSFSDYQEFVCQVQHALYGELEPRNKEEEEALDPNA